MPEPDDPEIACASSPGSSTALSLDHPAEQGEIFSRLLVELLNAGIYADPARPFANNIGR